jgi:2-keto-3-deoxy-L-rhamnonate aldolase RhmA
MFSAHSFGLSEPEYPATADDNLLVIVQIESKDGVKNVEEIAAVEGIDVLFIGEFGRILYLSTSSSYQGESVQRARLYGQATCEVRLWSESERVPVPVVQ